MCVCERERDVKGCVHVCVRERCGGCLGERCGGCVDVCGCDMCV